MLTEERKQEIIEKVKADLFKNDMRYLSDHQHNFFAPGSKDNIDKYFEFLEGFYEFSGGKSEPLRSDTSLSR